MLQEFKTLPLRHKNGAPLCMGLFCIDVHPSPYPYAWLDTIKHPDELTITLVESAREFDRKQVSTDLAKMIGNEATLPNIRQYLIDLAEDKLSKRQNYFDLQKRKYAKTHHAAHDVAFACRPSYASPRMLESLKRVREDISNGYVIKDDGLTMLGYNDKPKRWTWSQYEEPTVMIESLMSRFHGELPPLPINIWEKQMPLNTSATNARDKHRELTITDKRRWRTAKSRLQFLVAQAGRLRYIAQPTSFLEDVPCPIACSNAELLAQSDDLVEILLATEDWIAENFLMNHTSVVNEHKKSEPFQLRLREESIRYACRHKVEDGRIVADKPIANTTGSRLYKCAEMVEKYGIRSPGEVIEYYMKGQYPIHKAALEAKLNDN